MAGNTLEFTDSNFQTDVLESSELVLVDFWAPWCGPCRALTPTIEELAQDYAGRARIGKVNTDENPQTATQYSISSIPTVMLVKNGEVVDRFMGVVPKDKIVAAIDAHL